MDYSSIRNEVQSMIKPKRFLHSLNVEKETEKLCRHYGVDERKGKLAAILHDCAKGFNDRQLLEHATEYGIQIDEIMLALPDLLHGPVAAELARRRFELQDEEIYNAIWYHTTGRKGMSELEKILYLADMIEESRSFDGIDKIRIEARKNVDKALILSCNSTIEFVIREGRLIHPLTIELRNSLLMRGAVQIG